MTTITDEVFLFILTFKEHNGGVSPTMREIQKGCDLPSTSTVHKHLKKLEEHGRIIRTKSRRIRLPHDFYAESPLALTRLQPNARGTVCLRVIPAQETTS